MQRICPKCGSTSVLMFDADEDWCTQCKSRFPGLSTSTACSSCTSLRGELEDLKCEADRYKDEADLADAYKEHWKETDDRCGELQVEVERLTEEVGQLKQGLWGAKDREIERLKEHGEVFRQKAEQLETDLDRYKAAFDCASSIAICERTWRLEESECAADEFQVHMDKLKAELAEAVRG